MEYGQREGSGTGAQRPELPWKREKADEKKTEDERAVR